MHIEKEAAETVTTWKLRGSLDVFAIGSLRVAFASAGAPQTLVIDLAELTTIEPVAIGVLRQGLREQTAKGTRVALCGGSREIQRLLHLVGIARSFPMLATAEEASAPDAEVCAIIPPAAIPPRPTDPDLPAPIGVRSHEAAMSRTRPSVRGLARLFARRRVTAGSATAVINLGGRESTTRAGDGEAAHLETGQPA